MNVSSLDRSKELYRLSGWNRTEFLWVAPPLNNTEYEVMHKAKLHDLNDYIAHPELGDKMYNSTFAYDADYLGQRLRVLDFEIDNLNLTTYALTSDSLEDPDAAILGSSLADLLCAFAIEAFKQGVLTRGGDE